jgi:outer membrane protein assembly factor BamB
MLAGVHRPDGLAWALALLALACGAKSPLADADRESPPVAPPGTNPTHPEGCIAGLAPGAPAPIRGYCSDRAGRATSTLPSAPALLASLATESVIGAEPRVDASGRVYFAIDTDDTDSAVLEHVLIAVDPDASLVWTLEFEGRIGDFAIVADGTLRAIDTTWHSGAIERHVVHVSRDGALLGRHRLPEDAGVAFAVSSEGNLVFTPTGNESAGRVVATTTEGALVWRSDPLDGYAEPAAIGVDGRVFVSASRQERAEVVALDGATGHLAWRFQADGYASPVAVGPDGSLRFALAAPDFSAVELVALEPDGSERFRTALPGPALGILDPVCVDAVGRSYVRTSNALLAVDASGGVLLSREVHPNGVLSCATDPSQVLFYSSLGFAAVDVETGETLWSLDDGFPSAPGTIAFSGPVVLAGDRRLVLMDHDGGVHFIGD